MGTEQSIGHLRIAASTMCARTSSMHLRRRHSCGTTAVPTLKVLDTVVHPGRKRTKATQNSTPLPSSPTMECEQLSISYRVHLTMGAGIEFEAYGGIFSPNPVSFTPWAGREAVFSVQLYVDARKGESLDSYGSPGPSTGSGTGLCCHHGSRHGGSDSPLRAPRRCRLRPLPTGSEAQPSRLGGSATKTARSGTRSRPCVRRRRHRASGAQQRALTDPVPPALQILTQNVRGFAKERTRRDEWFDGLRQQRNGRRVDAVFLQETRAHGDWPARLEQEYALSWGLLPVEPSSLSFWSQPPMAAGGVAILLSPGSEITDARPLWAEHWSAHFIAVSAMWRGQPVTLVCIYGPVCRKLREALFRDLSVLPKPAGLLLCGGDFNCTLDAELDRSITRRKDYDSVLLWFTETGVFALS